MSVIVSRATIRSEDGTECWGLYDSSERLITLDGAQPLAHRWRVLFHELVHVWLVDAGLDNGIETRLHEAIADAVATGLVRAFFRGA